MPIYSHLIRYRIDVLSGLVLNEYSWGSFSLAGITSLLLHMDAAWVMVTVGDGWCQAIELTPSYLAAGDIQRLLHGTDCPNIHIRLGN